MRQSNRVSALSQRHRFTAAIRIVVACLLLAIIYPLLADETSDAIAFINAATIGLLFGIGIAIHQDYLAYRINFRRWGFIPTVSITALSYTLGFAIIVPAVYLMTRSIAAGQGVVAFIQSGALWEFMRDDYVIIVGWALMLTLFLSFSFTMRRHIAGNVLANMVFGKYSTPKEEYRAIMSIDINSATTIAEKLGPVRYYRLLNDVYAAITPAILGARGEIYRYVGDQITVSWKFNKHFDPAWCIRVFFIAQNLLDEYAELLYERYGLLPTFKAALHSGDFVVGEIGDVKCQLVLYGDAIYETQMIEKMCSKMKQPILVSGEFMKQVEIPGIYRSEHCTEMDLGDKRIELYAIREKEAGIEY